MIEFTQEPVQAGFWGWIAIFVVSTIISWIFRPRQAKDSPADFEGPITEEGIPVQVAFGTCKVAPSVTWFGDVRTRALEKNAPGLAGLLGQDIPLGFTYDAGMMLTICWGPIDQLIDMYIGDYLLSEQTNLVDVPLDGFPDIDLGDPINPALPIDDATNPTRINLYMPLLFGGPENGGGIQGDLDFHWGSLEQGPNEYLSLFWDGDVPRTSHYRRICYCVLRRVNLGKSPSPLPWWFVVKRLPNNLGDASKVDISGDANAAEILYELITDQIWGLGKPAAIIDVTSFQAVRDTLYSEGLGISFTMRSQSEAEEKIDFILEHIDGVLYQHPSTGLLTLDLIREDYTVGNLLVLDKSNAKLVEYTQGSWEETVNETLVTYTSRERRFTQATAQAQDLGAVQAIGEVISTTIDLPGLTVHDVAQKAAEQRNRESAFPLARLRITSQRVASLITPGQPIVANFPAQGVSSFVFRATDIDYGTLEQGKIEIEGIEDVFNLNNVVGSDPGTLNDGIPCGPLALLLPGYDPANDPNADYGYGEARLLEAPYWLSGVYRRIYAMVGPRTNVDIGWAPYVSNMGAPYMRWSSETTFCPVGLLEETYSREGDATDSTGFTVRSLGLLENLVSADATDVLGGANLAVIGDEIIAWTTVTNNGDGTYTISGIYRGQLDTVPLTHTAGQRVFFFVPTAYVDLVLDATDGYLAGHGMSMKPLRITAGGEDDPIDVDVETIVLGSRSTAPYPPGNVQVNSAGYDAWPAETTGDVTLSWTHRSRTEQTMMVAQDSSTAYTLDGSLTIEALVGGVVVRTWSDETGSSISYTYANRVSDDEDLSKTVRFRITPTGAGGVVGTVRTTPPFLMQSS